MHSEVSYLQPPLISESQLLTSEVYKTASTFDFTTADIGTLELRVCISEGSKPKKVKD